MNLLRNGGGGAVRGFRPLALAVGEEGSTYSDYGMSWDNSGKNGHYAPIDWSN